MTVIEFLIYLIEELVLMCPKHLSEKATGMILSNLIMINPTVPIQLSLYKPGSSETSAFRTENAFSHRITASRFVYLRF